MPLKFAFLLDENIEKKLRTVLQQAGYDALHIADVGQPPRRVDIHG